MDIIKVNNYSLTYMDGSESLKDINLDIKTNSINVLFGPGGGGKSTLLRSMNRLNDLVETMAVSGKILFNDKDIEDNDIDLAELRRKIGIVFSRPMPLPLSIYGNISFGLEMAGVKDKQVIDERVVESLKSAVLWDEVKDRLNDPAVAISGGQQQRLCLARVLALKPEVILLDEPTSALDPISTAKIEHLLNLLKEKYTIVLVPHNVQQAARMADYAAFFLQGEIIETGAGKSFFISPRDKRTQDYIEGRFG